MNFKRPIAKLKASEQTLTEMIRGRMVKVARTTKTTKKATKKTTTKKTTKKRKSCSK